MKTPKRKNPPTSVPPLRDYVGLSLVPGLGASRIKALLDKFGSAREIFHAEKKELLKVSGIGRLTAREILSFNRWPEVDPILERTRRLGAVLIHQRHPDYPSLLHQLTDPPLLFWVLGDTAALRLPGLAVIGTRRAGRYGLEQAGRFAEGIASAGMSVVSGLAYGVDAAAHRAALECGGVTVAVLGSGIDLVYPRPHRGLAGEIARSGGAVISEFPLGTPPEAGNFPVRNRVVSGMCYGTLVVESGEGGGSMITASAALDQCREVFAVPHPAGAGTGMGGNHLIQQGQAKLVTEVEHIFEELLLPLEPGAAPPAGPGPRWREEELDELSIQICRLLEAAPRHLDELVGELDLSPASLLQKLLELELKKCVRQSAGRVFELA